ncbi:MAG TPA: ABC transporter substrate-binding protein [Rubrivivax sp.]|nr:ABC transporter substrate-binding protein [Rubrivivax sp.]
MRRRDTLALGVALCALRPAAAQPAGKVFKLGWLRPNAPEPGEFQALGITAALQRVGWVEGQNLLIERRWADGRLAQLPQLARELVQQRCDALLSVGLSATRAMREATTTIPIVFFGNFDPVALGLVSSLARPDGNVSGVLIAPDGTLAPKKMELLKEAVPHATRVAFLAAEDPAMQAQMAEARRAAAALGQELVVVTARGGDHAGAFAAIVGERARAVFVAAHTSFVTQRRPIIELALRHKLPTMWEWAEQVRDGGLMAYGTSLNGLYDRIAAYIDRIFRGARIGEMPIEQPTTFALALNQATARAIGLNMPRALLQRADEVIE